MKIKTVIFLVILCLSLVPTSVLSVDPVITAALIGAGATLLTQSGNSGGGNLWELGGQTIDSDDCWQDGGGACPNGKYQIFLLLLIL